MTEHDDSAFELEFTWLINGHTGTSAWHLGNSLQFVELMSIEVIQRSLPDKLSKPPWN